MVGCELVQSRLPCTAPASWPRCCAADRTRVPGRARRDRARRRGDGLHRREEALIALAIDNDPARAVALARANFDVQREPADARVLAAAGRAARDAAALRVVEDW